jgi:hypothetical protein
VKDGLALLALAVLFLSSLGLLNAFAHGGDYVFRQSGGRFEGIPNQPWITPLLACVSLVLGVALVRTLTTWVIATSAAYIGPARAQAAGMVVSITLYIVLAVVVAGQTRLDLSGIALSGAVTGVIVGIAAQASLSNIIAGVVILFARPYRPGQYITARAAAFAGSEYSGEVSDITLFYTTLLAGTQEIRVPNSSMVVSVVVLRPQALDIYLPLALPLVRWEVISTAGLVHQLRAALPADRYVTATVERLDESTVQIGVRASVADDQERSLLERALVQILRAAAVDGHTAPDPASELHDV